jgi:hypothetical protein
VSNTLASYDPIWFANRALERLERRLTFVPQVFRAYEQEPRERGSIIRIRKPGPGVAQNMPIAEASASDLTPEDMDIDLDQWKGTLFAVRDDEYAYTGERYITEHIDPFVQALAQSIEDSLLALYKDVPWVINADTTDVHKDFTASRKRLNQNNVPFSNRTFAMNPTQDERYLNSTTFHQANTSSEGPQTQREGFVGRKFGFDTFDVPGMPSHTMGTASTGTLALVGAHAAGAATVNLDAGAVTGTLVPGDTFVIAGNTQRYAVTNTVTAAANAFTGVTITPPLAQAYADNAIVTVTLQSKEINLAFHRNAFALVMVPLSDRANGSGARIAYAQDPQTGLTLRFREWYDGGTAKTYHGYDALWGRKTLYPNMAVRVEN